MQLLLIFIVWGVGDNFMELLRKTVQGIWVWILGGPRGSARDSWRLPRAPAIPGSVCSAFCHPAHPLYPSIHLSAPIFLSQSAAQSVSVSLPLSSSPHFLQYYHISTEAESKHCWLDGYVFISDRLGLVDGLCLERASLLTIPLYSYLGSGWRVRHIQYCVYGYWRQPGQWMFLNVFNPMADSISATTLYKNSQFIMGLLYLCQHCMVFRIHTIVSKTKSYKRR